MLPTGHQHDPRAAAVAWRGVFPALCTPFDESGAIDPDAQRRVVRFALQAGSHGLVAFGLAGEVFRLTVDERRELTTVLVDEVDGQVPLLIGVGAEDIATAAALARWAEAAGAAGIVISCHPRSVLDEDGLVDYCVRVAAEVSLPAMVQDAPAHLGITLGVDLVERVIARADNVCLVKLEAGAPAIREWSGRLGDGVGVWGGHGGQYLLDSMRTGSPGVVPGVDIVDSLVEVYEAEASGAASAADELFARVLPLLVFELHHSIDHYNACAKHVLRRRGVLTCADLRSPSVRFDATSRWLLEQHHDRLEDGRAPVAPARQPAATVEGRRA